MHSMSKLAAAALMATAGATASAVEYANVISATPVIQQVAVPSQTCTDQVEQVQRAPTGLGAVLGAVAGGVVGNNVGGGFGRAAATGLGAVAGAVVGNNVESANTGSAAVPVRRCQNASVVQSRTVGYDVVYEYNGQRYTTRMASDPGPHLAVDVRPYAQATTPAPVEPAYTTTVAPAYTTLAPVYVDAPAYYGPPPGYYAAPLIGFGLGFGFGHPVGYHGGYHRWH